MEKNTDFLMFSLILQEISYFVIIPTIYQFLQFLDTMFKITYNFLKQ